MVGGCDVVAKRARWADVAPDTRHFCMQAALRAAGEPPARDVDLAGRRALCDGVVNWSKDDIMAYLDCAGLNTQGLGMRELMAAVRKHLGAD